MERTYLKKSKNSWIASTSRTMVGPVQKKCCTTVKIPKHSNVKQRVKETFTKKATVTPKKLTTTEKWTRTTTLSSKPVKKKASTSTSRPKPKTSKNYMRPRVSVSRKRKASSSYTPRSVKRKKLSSTRIVKESRDYSSEESYSESFSEEEYSESYSESCSESYSEED
ncbi:hypothetical protein TNCT_660392 [Trichonephila clavata]|uniref:Uncharacterized protein n=1 Tax=Trichonephila clavata TaxID=2740835 RepID=A0A8X6I3Q0_TRICU|nr:hypothetical protein TNCT_660392 [Trichonephila clavata]